MKIGIVQMQVTETKEKNLGNAERLMESLDPPADIVILPEMFNCPYEHKFFPRFAEPIPGPTTDRLSLLAQRLSAYIVGGSIPEKSKEKLFNSSPIISPDGTLLGVHRKLHLFDIDVPNKITFKESNYLTAGESITIIPTPHAKLGVAICYDLRFPELVQSMAQQGAELIVFPAAFNTTTGPAHWKTLLRARAIDNQVFVAACSPARNPDSSYKAYGHSLVVNPWGEVIEEAPKEETTMSVEIDPEEIQRVRRELPLWDSRKAVDEGNRN